MSATHIAAKAAQWEVAKGHLRALVALKGCDRLQDNVTTAGQAELCRERFTECYQAVESFIEEMENSGLCE